MQRQHNVASLCAQPQTLQPAMRETTSRAVPKDITAARVPCLFSM
jgi:hypothetical protein